MLRQQIMIILVESEYKVKRLEVEYAKNAISRGR